MAARRKCPRCGVAIKGYVDECPACGLDRPVPLPWYIYPIMLVIFIAAVWLFVDLEAIARAILGVRDGLRAM